jgi:hypothetical protein
MIWWSAAGGLTGEFRFLDVANGQKDGGRGATLEINQTRSVW